MMKAGIWTSLLLILLASAGCSLIGSTRQASQATQLPPSPVPLATIPTTPTPTLTATLTTTQSTPTLTQPMLPSPVNTLEPSLAEATLEPLLREPLTCDVPCFWGIIPRITYMDEVKDMFGGLGFTPFEGYDPISNRNFYTIDYDSTLGRNSTVTLFSNSDNLVTNIIIRPEIINSAEGHPRDWAAFSPENLIAQFGQPSHVQFALDRGPNFVIIMMMYFDNINLLVQYSGDNMIPDRPQSPRVCPLTLPFDHLRLWMGTTPPNPPLFPRVQLETATSLTIEQFTQLMLGDPQKACFVLNGDVFE